MDIGSPADCVGQCTHEDDVHPTFMITSSLRGIAFALAICCALASATSANAQQRCALPETIVAPELERIDYQSRYIKTDYFALALSWSPEHCATRGAQDPGKHAFQCRLNRFDFVVHGLWPQSAQSKGARGHPRHCGASVVNVETIKQTLCTVPSVRLIQGEWQKHGTCAFETPEKYYARTRQLWDSLQKPDLRALTRNEDGQITVGTIVDAFVAANKDKQLRAEHVAVQLASKRRLREVLICYNKSFAFTACLTGKAPPHIPAVIRQSD
jgi:ribonuclease T2